MYITIEIYFSRQFKSCYIFVLSALAVPFRSLHTFQLFGEIGFRMLGLKMLLVSFWIGHLDEKEKDDQTVYSLHVNYKVSHNKTETKYDVLGSVQCHGQ